MVAIQSVVNLNLLSIIFRVHRDVTSILCKLFQLEKTQMTLKSMIHYQPMINFSSIIYYFSKKMESTNATEIDVK